MSNPKSLALEQSKRAYAMVAHRVGKSLSGLGVLGDKPPSRDRRMKHWVFSLTRVHDSLGIAELGVPWWTYRAIDVVDAWLTAHPHPIRIFEYGSGASTVWLADRADEVISVEHHRSFSELIGPELRKHGNVKFQLVEARTSSSPAVPSGKEGNAGLDFADYVATIESAGGMFDLVVVDGRAREACLAAAIGHLAPGGIVVFDNSWRRRYRAPIEASGLTERRFPGLTPTLPYPDQTSVLSRP